MRIEKATLKDMEQIIPLFDQYRIFYKQESDINGAKEYLTKRLRKNESVIFLAYHKNKPVAFTQLYPMFSSVSMQPFFVLNDLFVLNDFRNRQIGEALLNRAKEFCMAEGAKGLALETAIDNPAQKLYEKLGWKKDIDCFHYFWTPE